MGKTVEVISLIVTNRPTVGEIEEGTPRGTLIVCPLSVLHQWQSELVKHTREGALKVYIFHGNNRSRDVEFLAQQDVILTTYATLSLEYSKKNNKKDGKEEKKDEKEERKEDLMKDEDNKEEKVDTSTESEKEEEANECETSLLSLPFFRVVLDEAHTIKDKQTRAAKSACSVKAARRWAVTGTPLQNKLEDLLSLILFLGPSFDLLGWWRLCVAKPLKTGNTHLAFSNLQKVLEKILLRRTKGEKVDDAPILELPPRQVSIKYVELTGEQKQFYTQLEKSAKQKFQKLVAEGTLQNNYAHILELLLRLRQTCDHPFLVSKPAKVSLAHPGFSFLQEFAQKFEISENLLAQKICLLSSAECGVCLESVESPVLTSCMHFFCSKCLESELASHGIFAQPKCPTCGQVVTNENMVRIAPSLAQSFTQGARRKLSKEDWKSSCKIDSLMEEVEEMTREEGVKGIVFSQWTSMLDLVEVALEKKGVSFVRLDGATVQAQRKKTIEKFNSDSKVRLFLISIKAGGVGLNLVAASRVFLLDIWWNPATEEQAIDRVHRLGQTRPVKVVRLIVKDSIEEQILKLQEGKRLLAQASLGAFKQADLKELRMNELKLLFRD